MAAFQLHVFNFNSVHYISSLLYWSAIFILLTMKSFLFDVMHLEMPVLSDSV